MATGFVFATRADRRGISIVVALATLVLVAAFIFAFSTYSSNELRLVQRAIDLKCAEHRAMSGIEWARDQLQKRRWYAAENAYWGLHEEPEPFGPGSGRLRVVCEDMRHPEIREYTYREAAMLSHVNVYSQAEYGQQAVLVYGRFLMSPMPWLRSDSTDGAPEPEDASTLGEYTAGERAVEVPRYPFEGGLLDARVETIHVSEGQSVAANAPLVTVMLAGLGEPTQVIAPAAGKVKRIVVSAGDTVPGGAVLVVLEPDDGSSSSSTVPFTLKAMVRVTKIVEQELARLDLDRPAAREAVRAHVSELSKRFVANHLGMREATRTLRSSPLPELPPRLGLQRALGLMPPGRAGADASELDGNAFIRDSFLEFAWPCTPAEELEPARQAINFVLQLEPPKRNPLVPKLFAALGMPYNTASPVETIPGPDAPARLLEVTGTPLGDPGYINRAGTFPAAQWSHSCRWRGKFATGEGGFDPATLGDGTIVDGVFYQGLSCTQRSHDRPYELYTEPGGAGRHVRVSHVLNFFRMMFTEAGAIAPIERIRLDLDLIDRVVYPPPGPVPMGGGAGDFG